MNVHAYSQHALERMQQRGIPAPAVEAVLRSGHTSPDATGLMLETILCGITVVTDPRTGNVVTVFTRRNPPARFSPKRLSRLEGQRIRRYLRNRRDQNWMGHLQP